MAIFRLRNPFPAYADDDERVVKVIGSKKLQPKRGKSEKTQHAYSKLLYDLFDLSTTHKSCTLDKSKWAFDGMLEVTSVKRPFLKGSRKKVEGTEPEEFYDFLDNLGLSFKKIIEISKELFIHENVTGDPAFIYKEVTFGSTKKVFITPVSTMNWMYLYKKKGSTAHDKVAVFEDLLNITKDNYREIPAFPVYNETKLYRETFFHFPVNCCGSKYGDSETDDRYQEFVEYALSDLSCKVSGQEQVSKYMLAVKAPTGSTGGKGEKDKKRKRIGGLAKSVKNITTSTGFDPATAAVMEFPEEAPELLKFDVNRDTDWDKHQTEKAASILIGRHRWSAIIMGYKEAASNSGGSLLLSEFITRISTIEDIQKRYQSIMFTLLNEIKRFGGEEERFKDFAIGYENKMQNTIDKMMEVISSRKNISK